VFAVIVINAGPAFRGDILDELRRGGWSVEPLRDAESAD